MTTGPLLFASTPDGLLFKPAVTETITEDDIKKTFNDVLQFSNHDQGVKVVGQEEFPTTGNITEIACLLGFIRLKLNRYAIVANSVEETARFNGEPVYKITQHSIIPVQDSARIDADEQEYIKLLNLQLNNAQLYFSYTYDLVNTRQRSQKFRTSIEDKIDWRNADTRFFWNHYLTEDLQTLAREDPKVDYFIQPVIYGFCKAIRTVFNYNPITLGLITRRSRFRAGTRYFRRGIDEDGNVGNFNETEQVLFVEATACNAPLESFSFVQTRGSVPVYWAEVNNLKYKPNLFLGDNDVASNYEATKKHFAEQEKIYGDNYLINLVNQSGYESPVKNAYEQAINALNDPKLHYIYFDFHHECRNMKWNKVKILIDVLQKNGFKSSNTFHKVENAAGETVRISSEQDAVIRTNCMDCLDRTNVVQSVIAHWVLQNAFEESNCILDQSQWADIDKSLLEAFQNLWADNADAVSESYSGTGALKTDFTRTGKRTKMGAFNDLINSISRYYQNNLTDGPRQDSYDLFLGNFKPYISSIQSAFPDRRPLYVQFIPIILIAAITVLFATILFPKGYFTSSKNLTFFLIASITIVALTSFIFKHGMQFVNWPKLSDIGFLVVQETHDKEQQFKGLKYVVSPRFSKPTNNKKD
ncbi:hypothetical protein TPHA_0F03640 [Tetrapisispora phaffii CBS 4417]|uniref:SAC domain-containing protein n=1 Tax=Tetrapisispora phaffii (strain ATCC 24235 / CBS 4417 / NBRC 1672 / NRRL Y-8282 / UCD 70-5) TaxID=1071381 RepID=G8BUQ8_TETPH|nr:hypothetical protein TPHA_0F03640 [Tetrapisispora phaffii CBS 4417]CCE63844.1 hypothetical protein TPHA_0F03640 [Tetrapisispora phaffii CBS 4417]